ncbi:MAG: hypothetical protein ACOX9C_10625, partial [Kiritimatiellia bacterium]
VLAEACAQWAERETKVGIKPNPLKIRNLKGVQTVIFRWNFGLKAMRPKGCTATPLPLTKVQSPKSNVVGKGPASGTSANQAT